MTSEFFVFIFIAFIFMDLLWEDRKIYVSVIELKDEAVRRLKITEIYTRKTLVESIEKGIDPTKFQPNNIFIATLFSDIRDFTGISEGLKPLEVVDMLNAYFNRMNGSIIKYNGEIDKLMGDCIMALFKDPDNALKSAIEIRYELDRFNNVGAYGRSPLQQQINNGIGLNYGEVIIGNIGSESKMDYTVVGDIVNTASRLEALTKYYKTPLIVSEELKVRLKDSYDIRFLDEALIKGKSTPVRIYEVYDFETDDKKETRSRNLRPMEEAFALYQSGDFPAAENIYNELAVRNGDPSLPFFIERCHNLQLRKDAGLLRDWNGVFEFMDK
jgi:class 3 adenylate cyclase